MLQRRPLALTRLCLQDVELSTAGVSVLADFLCTDRRLSHLALSCTLDTAACTAMGRALRHNAGLLELVMDECIGLAALECVGPLADALEHNTALRTISFVSH